MSVAPSQFPPPVDSAKEFIGAPTDPEDERIEVGVAIVGGGQAGLACAIRLRPVPPPFRNHGNYVVSVAELNRWLAEKAEEAGAYILTETTGHKLLVEDGVVRGVRTGDKGRDKDGGEKSNFEPGSDVVARATVLA